MLRGDRHAYLLLQAFLMYSPTCNTLAVTSSFWIVCIIGLNFWHVSYAFEYSEQVPPVGNYFLLSFVNTALVIDEQRQFQTSKASSIKKKKKHPPLFIHCVLIGFGRGLSMGSQSRNLRTGKQARWNLNYGHWKVYINPHLHCLQS